MRILAAKTWKGPISDIPTYLFSQRGPMVRSFPLMQQPSRPKTEPVATQDEAQVVAAVIDRLFKKFPETPRSKVEEIVSEEYTALSDGQIRDYVPVLIERAAKLRLRR